MRDLKWRVYNWFNETYVCGNSHWGSAQRAVALGNPQSVSSVCQKPSNKAWIFLRWQVLVFLFFFKRESRALRPPFIFKDPHCMGEGGLRAGHHTVWCHTPGREEPFHRAVRFEIEMQRRGSRDPCSRCRMGTVCNETQNRPEPSDQKAPSVLFNSTDITLEGHSSFFEWKVYSFCHSQVSQSDKLLNLLLLFLFYFFSPQSFVAPDPIWATYGAIWLRRYELSSGSRRVAGSISHWVCRSVLEQDP